MSQGQRNKSSRGWAPPADEDLSARHEAWRRAYGLNVAAELGYVTPRRIAEVAATYLRKDARLLDAGCGTGLVAEALAEKGFDDLAGIDGSEAMVAEAAKKQVYGELRRMDLGPRLGFQADTFDGIVSVSVLTIGRVPPAVLDEFIRITRPDGYVIFAMRPAVQERGGFQEKAADLEVQGKWRFVEVTEPFAPVLDEDEELRHQIWVYQVKAGAFLD